MATVAKTTGKKGPGPATGVTNPGRTPEEEIEVRVSVTIALMQKGWRKSKIKRRLIEMFGVSARTCESYLSRAREEMRNETGRSRSEHIEDMYAVLTGIISDPDTTNLERIRAVREIRSLLLLSNDRAMPAAILNQQINLSGGTVQSEDESQDDQAIGDLDTDARRTLIRNVAERIRTRRVVIGVGGPGDSGGGALGDGALSHPVGDAG